jgi:Tfp pilus assembly protein PilN
MAAQKKQKKRDINLLPQKEFEASIYGRILKWSLSTFRFIVIAVEAVVILGFLSRFTLDVQNTDLTDQIDENRLIIESFAQIENEFRRTQKKLEVFNAYTESGHLTEPVFGRVVSRMPSQVKLSSMNIKEGKIVVIALGSSEQSIAQFISNLNDESSFTDVSLISSESNSDDPFIRFQLQIGMDKSS